MTVALAILAGTVACLGLAAVIAGALIAEVLDERDRRRDSRPRPGTLLGCERGPAARVLLLPDAGPPPGRDRARLPGLRPPGRAVETSSRRH